MLTLSLLRHAKSSWSDRSLDDFERPLHERGKEAAPRMGAFMARHGIAPDLILCSPAVRTRRTLELVLQRLTGRKGGPEVAYEKALYLASAAAILRRIREVAAEVRHTMIVGHDPGIHAAALELAGSGPEEDLDALARKFPTAGLAVIVFEAQSWGRVQPGAGRLELFMTPKRLP